MRIRISLRTTELRSLKKNKATNKMNGTLIKIPSWLQNANTKGKFRQKLVTAIHQEKLPKSKNPNNSRSNSLYTKLSENLLNLQETKSNRRKEIFRPLLLI